MEKLGFDCPITFKGYATDIIDDIMIEKDRVIKLQERDMEELKREIVDLKRQLNCSKNKKKWYKKKVSQIRIYYMIQK